MLTEWLQPLLQWLGIDLIPLLLLAIAGILIFKE